MILRVSIIPSNELVFVIFNLFRLTILLFSEMGMYICAPGTIPARMSQQFFVEAFRYSRYFKDLGYFKKGSDSDSYVNA